MEWAANRCSRSRETQAQGHRVIFAMIDTAHFPQSFLVGVEELTPLDEPILETGDHQPVRDVTYTWNPPATDQIQPPDRAPVPTPPRLVKVKQARWETTRVVLVNAVGEENGDEFHVFPHHLERRIS